MKDPKLLARQLQFDRRRHHRPLGLDDTGRIVHLDTLMDERVNKHVFTARYDLLLEFPAHHVFEDWHHNWDWYTQHPDNRKALAKLTGGRLPSELYQVEILLQRWQSDGQRVGHDGPFALTTHAAIKTHDHLLRVLRHMPREDLSALLINCIHATFHAP